MVMSPAVEKVLYFRCVALLYF